MWNRTIHLWLRAPYFLHARISKKPKKSRATILFIHGIGESGTAWQPMIDKLPKDIRTISIDLLGFGKSPKPRKAEYNAKIQARSVVATLLRSGVRGRIIIVGHSLGALVAVEIAKRYPLYVKKMILCSPPLYINEEKLRVFPTRDTQLKKLYKFAQKHPEQLIKISDLAIKYGFANKVLELNKDNIHSFMSALESNIINQTSLADAAKIKKPTLIIHAAFDPLVIKKNLKYLADVNPHINLTVIPSGHEIIGNYIQVVVDAVNRAIDSPSTPVKRGDNRL